MFSNNQSYFSIFVSFHTFENATEVSDGNDSDAPSTCRLTYERTDEPTWRCHQNPFIGALGIQEPVIPGEPLIKG